MRSDLLFTLGICLSLAGCSGGESSSGGTGHESSYGGAGGDPGQGVGGADRGGAAGMEMNPGGRESSGGSDAASCGSLTDELRELAAPGAACESSSECVVLTASCLVTGSCEPYVTRFDYDQRGYEDLLDRARGCVESSSRCSSCAGMGAVCDKGQCVADTIHLPCSSSEGCNSSQYCHRLVSGAADGICELRPEVCNEGCPGVCGEDGKRYCSTCDSRRAGVDVNSSDTSCGEGKVEHEECEMTSECESQLRCCSPCGQVWCNNVCTVPAAGGACPDGAAKH